MCFYHTTGKILAPFVQRLDNSIHWIYHYHLLFLSTLIYLIAICPVVSVNLSDEQVASLDGTGKIPLQPAYLVLANSFRVMLGSRRKF